MARCAPDPRQDAARRGYPDADFETPSALEAFDSELEPFDIMAEADLAFPALGVWTRVVAYQMQAGKYGVLRYLGQDCNDPTAYQRVSWRVLRNGQGVGGDSNGLMPALEARCGILDGTMMPFRLFLQPGALVELQAMLVSAAGAEDTQTVRGRLQGERRGAYGGVGT